MRGRVLIVAGSDSGGGAGIQADIKTVTALGGYAATAISALTAQNTLGVNGIHDIPADFVALQMRLVLDDIGADCIKIGMLHRPDVVAAVCDVLDGLSNRVPVVVDPVMIAKGGDSLLTAEAMSAVKARLIPLATVATPNLPEAAALAGIASVDPAELAQAVLALGPDAVLVKGGHGVGATVVDLLVGGHRPAVRFASERIETPHTHGTGCTLASAIATGLAQGMDLAAAVGRARAYVVEAIRTAPGFGHGHGPLNHAHTVAAFTGERRS
ncbi:MAG: bifunctional hydroxymethylpyrimidine kinase/phosphomethylpyrimidine kinase [Rhodospirillales bacterium]|nr:bifunctional hydroxymethylpyrimidine kinase/phosphomethylpyrimidine kinase [Rhodospirillales bacterium]